MKRAHVGPLLAVSRELDSVTRKVVEAHLAVCADCRALQRAYEEQDHLLSELLPIRPSAQWQNGLRARVHALPRSKWTPLSRQATWLAAALLIVIAMSLSAAAASAQALPGDWLYPVKRTIEHMTVVMLADPQKQADYVEMLSARRRAEARRVLELGRATLVEFDGTLQLSEKNQWTVADIPVALDSRKIEEAGLKPGDRVKVFGKVSAGEINVLDIRMHERNRPQRPMETTHTPTPTNPATPAPSPTREPTVTRERAIPVLTVSPTETPRRPSPTPEPAIEVTVTKTSSPDTHRSPTPTSTETRDVPTQTATATSEHIPTPTEPRPTWILVPSPVHTREPAHPTPMPTETLPWRLPPAPSVTPVLSHTPVPTPGPWRATHTPAPVPIRSATPIHMPMPSSTRTERPYSPPPTWTPRITETSPHTPTPAPRTKGPVETWTPAPVHTVTPAESPTLIPMPPRPTMLPTMIWTPPIPRSAQTPTEMPMFIPGTPPSPPMTASPRAPLLGSTYTPTPAVTPAGNPYRPMSQHNQ